MNYFEITVDMTDANTPPEVTPTDINPQPGDRVGFEARGDNMVVCLPNGTFNKSRLVVYTGDTQVVRVLPSATGTFNFEVHCGSLSANCVEAMRIDAWGGGGGGHVGGPD